MDFLAAYTKNKKYSKFVFCVDIEKKIAQKLGSNFKEIGNPENGFFSGVYKKQKTLKICFWGYWEKNSTKTTIIFQGN